MAKQAALPYLVAGTVACLIVGGGVVFVRHARSLLQARIEETRQQLRAQQEQGRLPPEWQGVDLENLQSGDVGMKVSAGEMTRLEFAELLATFRYVLVPLIFALCFGAAALWSRAGVRRDEPADSKRATQDQ